MTIHSGRGRTIAVVRDFDPFQAGVLIVCLIYGAIATGWYGTLATGSVRSYPGLGGRIFLASLAVGSLTALVGMLQHSLRGMRLERAGLWLLVFMCAAYALWSPSALGLRALPLTLWLGLLVSGPSLVVALRRGRQINQVERTLHERPEVPGDGSE